MNRYLSCLRLNWQMLKNVIGNRWLTQEQYEASYDALAHNYNGNWLLHLKSVTDQMLVILPDDMSGIILDLGCGTGYSTAKLEKKYPHCGIKAVDLSEQMLNQARAICDRAEFIHADMLDFLSNRPDSSVDMVVSAWAVGYSNPSKIFEASQRVLKPGGTLAFVVNFADTMAPVFYAFRHAMAHFPEHVRCALKVNYPVKWQRLEKTLMKYGFQTQFHKDGRIPVAQPDEENFNLDWLLRTGVLAGFDTVLPLKDNKEIAEFFMQKMLEHGEPLTHHYIIYKGVKK